MNKKSLAKLIEKGVNDGLTYEEIADKILNKKKSKLTIEDKKIAEDMITPKQFLYQFFKKDTRYEVIADRFSDGSSSWLEIKRKDLTGKQVGDKVLSIAITFDDDDITLQDIELWEEEIKLDGDTQRALRF